MLHCVMPLKYNKTKLKLKYKITIWLWYIDSTIVATTSYTTILRFEQTCYLSILKLTYLIL